MDPNILFGLTAMLFVGGLGAVAYAFLGGSDATQKRIQSLGQRKALGTSGKSAADANQLRRKNVQALLADIEKQSAEQKQRPSLRRRLDQAGLEITPRSYWLICATGALSTFAVCLLTRQPLIASVLGAVGVGFGVPRWALSFLRNRRLKKFTIEFANAIDVIVRSIKSGLPTNEALKIVAKEAPAPVGPEFTTLCDGLKIGVTMEQGLKRMYERIPTPEVNFFAIVMTVQQKSGGNLSEALGNLAGVLRDRKRLQGKIKAMSSEAKASAMIIGSLPPGVMGLVYLSTPDYIKALFTERMGNLMLMACVAWMACGVFVMSKMISFKH
jgi:tight adherence protein B